MRLIDTGGNASILLNGNLLSSGIGRIVGLYMLLLGFTGNEHGLVRLSSDVQKESMSFWMCWEVIKVPLWANLWTAVKAQIDASWTRVLVSALRCLEVRFHIERLTRKQQ